MRERGRQEALVAAALRRLGREPAACSVTGHLLAGGLSGSSVYSLDLAGEAVALKLTPPSEDRQLMERARREHRFYHDLSTRVPLKVPRVLGLDFDVTAGAVMLLSAYEPSPPPDLWTMQAYEQVAQQLGRLHATFWGQDARTDLPGWLRAKPHVTLVQCRKAAKLWRDLSERDDLQTVLEPSRRTLERLIMSIPALDPQMVTVPATLCHGDCHAGNLLRDPAGEWVWADWQEVRLGPGVDDLAFFWQRAFVAAGTRPPYEAMVQAYRAGLESESGSVLPQAQLEHNLAWAELRSWLVDWPWYLGAAPAARIERVVQRITTLIDHFEATGDL